MSDPEIPDEAVLAAAHALHHGECGDHRLDQHPAETVAIYRSAAADVLAAALPALRRQWAAELLPLIENLTDRDPCERFDHHGFCQTHGWLATDPPCPHGRAQDWLREFGEGT